VLESLEDGTEKDQMKYQLDQAKNKIVAWKAHILRSINQDQAQLEILQNLGPESALLVLDWAMKFLSRKFREAQSDWFGKRGISWHITVAMRRIDEGIMQMLTFVHVFEK
jgi:transposase InsO family protein